MRKLKSKKGITLIPLVITIILLLILAGVSIRAIGGENGIIAKTKIAKEENRKSEYKDYLSIAKTEAVVEKGGQDINLDEYIEQIKADKIEGIKNIEKITEEKAKLVTDEGYIFIITVNTIDYYENENNLPEMDIDKANIEFAFNPNTWTNGSVEVIVSKQESKYKIQLSKDGTKWTTTSTIIYTENGVVYARLIDEIGRTSDYASRKIDIIDKTAPTIDSIVGSQTTGNTGTISINGISDANQSGISGIYISQTNIAPTASTNGWVDISNSNYSLAVSQNGTYYIWVKDKLGNISKTRSCTVSGIVAKVQFTGYSSVSVTAPNSVQPALSYVGTPKSITYVSSNTGIASVNGQGVVTGASVGKATITAIATNYDGTQTSISCQVAVSQYLYGGGTGAFLNADNMWISNGRYDSTYGWGEFGTYLPGTNGCIGLHNHGTNFFSYIRSYNVFDVTNASKMVMNIRIWSDYPGEYEGTYQAGISDTSHQLDVAYDNTFVRCSGYYKKFNLGVANAGVSETWTVDLNGVSGAYFFKMYMYKGAPNGYDISFIVNSILLQP